MWRYVFKVLPYVFYLLLISFFQILLSDITSIMGARIAILPLVIFLISIYKNDAEAIWFSAAAVFVTYTVDPIRAGTLMIVAALLVSAAGYLKARLNLGSRAIKISFIAFGTLILESISQILITYDGFLYTLVRFILPSTLYTTLVSAFFFALVDKRSVPLSEADIS